MSLTNAQRSLVESVAKRDMKAARQWARAAIVEFLVKKNEKDEL